MEKSINILIQETKNKLMKDITDSQLPATVVQMIVNEIRQNVDIQTAQILQREIEYFNKKEEVKETKNE